MEVGQKTKNAERGRPGCFSGRLCYTYAVETEIDSMERQISKDLSPEEIETLSCLLEKIRNNLRTEHCEN